MNAKTLSTLALMTLGLGFVVSGPVAAMPATPLAGAPARATLVQYYDDDYYEYRRSPRIVVRPSRQPYFDDYSNFYPAVRGFGDRNPVPRGNRRGCTVDLGYGHYESC